jgi:hypothetical protein
MPYTWTQNMLSNGRKSTDDCRVESMTTRRKNRLSTDTNNALCNYTWQHWRKTISNSISWLADQYDAHLNRIWWLSIFDRLDLLIHRAWLYRFICLFFFVVCVFIDSSFVMQTDRTWNIHNLCTLHSNSNTKTKHTMRK